MRKKNFEEAIKRNKRFLKREMMDGILLKVSVRKNPYQFQEERDTAWMDRPPLCLTDREWVLESCRRDLRVYQEIDDDTIPEGYPTRCNSPSASRSSSRGSERGFSPAAWSTSVPLIRWRKPISWRISRRNTGCERSALIDTAK